MVVKERKEARPVRCPLCKRKLMLDLAYGAGHIWCRHCKQVLKVDRKPLPDID